MTSQVHITSGHITLFKLSVTRGKIEKHFVVFVLPKKNLQQAICIILFSYQKFKPFIGYLVNNVLYKDGIRD